MTYLEKYKKEHPGLSEEEYQSIVRLDCPVGMSGHVLSCPPYSLLGVKPGISTACPACWNREIPGTENTKGEENTMNKNFTKADLKAGYVVKYRSRGLRMVLPYTDGLVFTDLNRNWLDVSDAFNDDLTLNDHRSGSTKSGLDVMEVYGLSKCGSGLDIISTRDRELLWKREEKTCDDCAHKVVCSHVGMCEHFTAKKEG